MQISNRVINARGERKLGHRLLVKGSLLKGTPSVFNEVRTELFTALDTHHDLYWIIQDISEIGGHILCSCYMGHSIEKEFWHKCVLRRLVAWWWPPQKWIRMKPIHIPDASINGPRMMDCYCRLHMQTFHNRCSKCPPYTVKYGAVLLIFWYLQGPCREKKCHTPRVVWSFFIVLVHRTHVKCSLLFQKHPV
jgi:hypothetical protein